uniref:RING-type domain-containing protein n=1 Tax=Trichuris muris TaxID=70415 RepID=A0A5S6QGD6_TRIMR
MGQVLSGHRTINQELQARCLPWRNAMDALEWSHMSFDEFARHVDVLNYRMRNFKTRCGLQIKFFVSLDESLRSLYQLFVIVTMTQVLPGTDAVVYSSSLNFHEFRKHYALLCSYLDKSCSQLICDAIRVDRNFDSSEATSANSDSRNRYTECCICQERPVDSALPCCHEFCTVCILQWAEYRRTCPMCRRKLKGPEDAWLMPQAPALNTFIDEYASAMMR